MTRVFSLLGADLPKNMLGGNPANEAGHWESLDLLAIHDSLLATAGSRWDDWRAFNPDWIRSGVAEGYSEKLLGVLRNDYAGSALFVVKDPRICQFVPLWLEVLDRFGAKCSAIIPVRNPLEVAASHKRRDGFPPVKSFLLWLRHVLDAEKATRGLPRAIVTYSGLLDDWRNVVGAVAAKTGLHWPRRSDRAELDIDRFLAEALRHHVVDDAQLSARADIVDWVKVVYRLLRDMAIRRETKDQFGHLDRIHAEFDKACATFGLVLAAEADQSAAQLQSAGAQIKTRDEEVIRLSGELTQAHAAANEAQMAAAASYSQTSALATELEAVRAEGERRIAEIGASLAATTAAADELNCQRDQLAVALEEERTAATRNNAQSALVAQELEALRNVVSGHEAAATKLRAELDNVLSVANGRQSELDKLSRELTSVRSVLRDRDCEIERLSRDVEATRRSLRDSQTEVQRLAGELDGARTEIVRSDAAGRRISELLQAGREALSLTTAELPVVQGEIALLKTALEDLRQEADRRNKRIDESSKGLNSAVAQASRKEDDIAATHAARIRDLEARLESKSAENNSLAGELARMTDEIRRIEKSVAERVAALETSRAAALAESESKARAQIRALRDQLIDAEAGLAKAKRGRNGAWATPFSKSRRAARQLKNSGLFDAEWYLREYPDVAKSGRSPAEHYLEEGYLRGYRPNPLFDTRWYLERYEDVRRAGVNPAVHYLMYGSAEGRDPGPNFQTCFYLETNPDVRGNGINPLAHYLRYGRHEGRLPAPRA